MKIKFKKPKSPKSMFMGKVGKTPTIDWLVLSVLFVCFVIAAAVWSAFHFIETKRSLNDAAIVDENGPVITKTEQEKLEEILQIYEAKKSRHLDLLEQAKIDTALEKKNVPATVSTSTSAIVSTSSKPVSGSGAGANTGANASASIGQLRDRSSGN
jgi:hypothetical protein